MPPSATQFAFSKHEIAAYTNVGKSQNYDPGEASAMTPRMPGRILRATTSPSLCLGTSLLISFSCSILRFVSDLSPAPISGSFRGERWACAGESAFRTNSARDAGFKGQFERPANRATRTPFAEISKRIHFVHDLS